MRLSGICVGRGHRLSYSISRQCSGVLACLDGSFANWPIPLVSYRWFRYLLLGKVCKDVTNRTSYSSLAKLKVTIPRYLIFFQRIEKKRFINEEIVVDRPLRLQLIHFAR